MKINYEVKELTEKVLEPLEGLLETLKNLSETGDMNKEEIKKILSKINSQGSHIYVAITDDNKIIGATTLLVEQKFIHKGGLVGHIEDVATRKGYEEMGVGSAVVKKAIEGAEKAGCYKLILDCKDPLIPF